MKIAAVVPPGSDTQRPALREDETFLVPTRAESDLTVGDLFEWFLDNGPTGVRNLLNAADPERFGRDELTIEPPLDPSARVFAMGGTYSSHLREQNRSLFTVPHQWLVPDTAIIGPDSAIELPERVAETVKPAIEMAIVIGKGGSYIGEQDALNHIAGYTVSNDVTARAEWPGPRGYKIMDTFSPVGPHVTTVDEVRDPMDLSLTIRLDGAEICSGSTAGHRFTLSFLVSYLSTMYELRPGDVISTGDPGGVGDRLRPGKTVELAVKKVGTLSNDVVEADR